MELFSTLQLKYSRNRRLKCDLILNAMPERKYAVGFMNNLTVGSGLGDSLKTLSIIIIYKSSYTKEEAKSNRTQKTEKNTETFVLQKFLLHFLISVSIHCLNTPLTSQRALKYVFTLHRVRSSISFPLISKYQRNCCLSSLHCHMNTQEEERVLRILLSSEFFSVH